MAKQPTVYKEVKPADVEQAKQDAVKEVKGPDTTQVVVGQPAVPVPKVADLYKELESLKASIPGLITQAVGGMLSTVETALNQISATQDAARTAQAQAFNQTLNSYVTTAAMTTALSAKAATSALTGLATTQALADGLALKLNKAGDTATGPIMVPVAASRMAAPRFEQMFLGINRPIRTKEGVTSTNSALDPYTDTTGLNRRVMPVGIQFAMTTAPAGGLLGSAVLKVGTTPGGSEVYMKTIGVLTGLLNKVLAVETPTSAVILQPGATLYVTASSGTWIAFVDAVFLPNAS